MLKHEPVKSTRIAFVLDSSGSMMGLRDAVIKAFNEQLGAHRENIGKGGSVFFSFYTFSDNVESVLTDVPLGDLQGTLTEAEYRLGGCTALYDGIGKAIQDLSKHDQPGDHAFLVVILSDGHENSSKKYRAQELKSKIEELTSNGRWTFTFVGCEGVAIKDAVENLKLPSFTFKNSTDGVNSLSGKLMGATAEYYGGRVRGLTAMANFAGASLDLQAALNTDEDK